MATDPAPACPECGARRWTASAAGSSWGSWAEGDDPQLQAVHYLTVATYNLQHPAQFTPAALAGLRAGFVDHLDHGVDVAELRRRTARWPAPRGCSSRSPSAPRPARWSLTIADVYTPDRPEGAAGRVRDWAGPCAGSWTARHPGRGRGPGVAPPAPGHPAPALTGRAVELRGTLPHQAQPAGQLVQVEVVPHPKVLGVSRRRSAGFHQRNLIRSQVGARQS